AGGDNLPGGGHDLGRDQVLAREAKRALEPPAAAAERQPTDAGGRYASSGDGEPVLLRGSVELTPECAALNPCDACLRVDLDTVHRAQVDHQPGIARAVPGCGMTAATNGQWKLALAREVHGGHDIGGRCAPRYGCRIPVRHAVPALAGLAVGRISRRP